MPIINPNYDDFKNNQVRALDYREYRSTWDVLRASSMYFRVAVKSEDLDETTQAIGRGLVTTAWHEDNGSGTEQIHIKVSKGSCIKDNQAILFQDDFEFVYDMLPHDTTYYVYIRYKFIPERPDVYATVEIRLTPVPSADELEFMLIAKVLVDVSAVVSGDAYSGITVDLSARDALTTQAHYFNATNILGGNNNTLVYQDHPDSTSFIVAPTDNDSYLTWDSTNGFHWTTTVVSTANLRGGAANQIPYQSDSDQTSFISAPTENHSYLVWTGSTFQWDTSVQLSRNIKDGHANQIIYQSQPSETSFIDAPGQNDTYLHWSGSSFEWVAITHVEHSHVADYANALVGGAPNQIPYQTNTNVTNFITAPAITSAYLTWDNGSFKWVAIPTTIESVAGGSANEILYQSAPNHTSFITAPVDSNSVLVWTGVVFEWQKGAPSIKGGNSNQILYQTDVDQTGFISAPTDANRVLSWDGSNFVWIELSASHATTADNLSGGQPYQIPYQSASDQTSFIGVPPSGTEAYLHWTGTTFDWATGSTTNYADCAGSLAGGSANQIPVQTDENQTGFINAPTTNNAYLKWSSSAGFVWEAATGTTETAEKANNLSGGQPYQIPYQSASDQTSFIGVPPSGTEAYLHWTGTTFDWATIDTQTAANIYGGAPNQIVYQTGSSQTDFIDAPGTANTFLKWDGSHFVWVSIDTSGTSDSANNIAGGGPNQIVYQTDVNQTSFISAPTTANVYLKWNGSSFTWEGATSTIEAAERANNLSGGDTNQIPIQTSSNQTSFISVPDGSRKYQYLIYDGTNVKWTKEADSDTGAVYNFETKTDLPFSVNISNDAHVDADTIKNFEESFAPAHETVDVNSYLDPSNKGVVKICSNQQPVDLLRMYTDNSIGLSIYSRNQTSAMFRSDANYATLRVTNSQTIGSIPLNPTDSGYHGFYELNPHAFSNDPNYPSDCPTFTHLSAAFIESCKSVGLTVYSNRFGIYSHVDYGINDGDSLGALDSGDDEYVTRRKYSDTQYYAAVVGTSHLYPASKFASTHNSALVAHQLGFDKCAFAVRVCNAYTHTYTPNTEDQMIACATGGIHTSFDFGVGYLACANPRSLNSSPRAGFMAYGPPSVSDYNKYYIPFVSLDHHDDNALNGVFTVVTRRAAIIDVYHNNPTPAINKYSFNIRKTGEAKIFHTELRQRKDSSGSEISETYTKPAFYIEGDGKYECLMYLCSKYDDPSTSLAHDISQVRSGNYMTRAGVVLCSDALPGVIVKAPRSNTGIYVKAGNAGVVGVAGTTGVYGYADSQYGIEGVAYQYAVYGDASAQYGVYGCSHGNYGVVGWTGHDYAVAGNTAYYNSSDTDLKYKTPICIQECLRKNPIQTYKYTWSDSNSRTFSEFIGPVAQDIEETFDLIKSVPPSKSNIEEVFKLEKQKIPRPTEPKNYDPQWRSNTTLYTLQEIKNFEKYDQNLREYKQKLDELRSSLEENPPETYSHGMYTIDGIAFALANENFQCIMDFEQKIQTLTDTVNQLKQELAQLQNSST